jgi:phosphoglycolate phosphatase-like HAD superfamily hydrolase
MAESQAEVLALDFDGVISDSVVESFVVAGRTLSRLDPGAAAARATLELEGGDAAAVRSHPLYGDFLDLMPLGNRAEDFGVALRLLEQGRAPIEQPEFDAFREELGSDFLQKFHRVFYEERVALRSAGLGGWLALLEPFEPFVELLRRRAEDRILTVATAKDRASIELLLDAYGIAELFPGERVIDKEAGRSKRAHLGLLGRRLGVAYEQITFIDDKLNHLEDVAGLGVRCALAGWGYNGPRERQRAARQGFLVCDLASAEEDLFGAPAGV